MVERMGRLSWLVVLATIGCGGPTMSARMRMGVPQQAPPSADPSNATVVFLMPSDRVLANAIVDETGRAYGELPPHSRLIATVPPGPHTFTKVLYKNPGNGDFSLWGHEVCNQLGGVFEAGKIYFVELSVWRPFVVHADNPNLAQWAGAPSAELDLAKGPASVAADPEWSNCVERAQKNMAKDQSKNDQRSIVTAADGLNAWPH